MGTSNLIYRKQVELMSTYADLVAIINSLPSGTSVEITVSWCNQYGLTLTPSTAKEWGRRIHKEYAILRLNYLGKSSNNLHHYKKL